ncbi:class II histone deacetylase [Leucobacter sp. CSA1]|uniref:Class II histone deacetylase n=1 Tax=Leucobacter chromiisoli TaxID=2796471 RepID=A0A934Q8S0_9MICO|nr:class II histone deacetylase [Leucobacter chromiisoli]MBK0419936.1 class II histone deacetylase [Leucobacter chromiisoli]
MTRGDRVGFVTDERFFWHDARDAGGPWVEQGAEMETPEARRRFLHLLGATRVDKLLHHLEPAELSREDLLRVHPTDYLDRFKELSDADGGSMGDYANFGHGSYEICVLAAGGVYAAVEAVVTGGARSAYALVRPPGHHAEADRGRGYCLLGNIPIAIQKARAELGVRRIAVIDWDVHHGNGTQSIFWDDADVLSISIHQHQLFPFESGRISEVGGDGARGSNVNIPLPAGAGIGAYEYAFERVVAPSIDAFQPELIIIASGFDASGLDPMGRMLITPEGFRTLTRLAQDLADRWTDGRLVFAQEGGYSRFAVPFSGLFLLTELLGIEPPVPFGDFEYLDDLDDQRLNPYQRERVDEARAAAQSSGAIPG